MYLRSSDPQQRGGSCGPWSTAHPVAPGPSGRSCAAGATGGSRSESSQPAPGRQVHGAFSGSDCGSDTGPRRVSGDLRESWKERAGHWIAGPRGAGSPLPGRHTTLGGAPPPAPPLPHLPRSSVRGRGSTALAGLGCLCCPHAHLCRASCSQRTAPPDCRAGARRGCWGESETEAGRCCLGSQELP